ncbi:MAG: hypothetical protein ABFD20_11530 [Anaerolineales bacterium]
MQVPTAPNGSTIEIRPAGVEHLAQIPWRCWGDDPQVLRRVFGQQETIGIIACEGERCVGVLYAFCIELPTTADCLPSERLHYVLETGLTGLAWCHACFHVGRMIETSAEFEQQSNHSQRSSIFDGTDQRYFSRGIGTALLSQSVAWARQHRYGMVIGQGAPTGLFNYCVWRGMLPYTTYTRLGFQAVRVPQEGDPLPTWVEGDAPPEVRLEAQAALSHGRLPHTLNTRVMYLRL